MAGHDKVITDCINIKKREIKNSAPPFEHVLGGRAKKTGAGTPERRLRRLLDEEKKITYACAGRLAMQM